VVAQALLDLVDWRRRVGDLYRVRGENAIDGFRSGRDDLFKTHPQSPIEPDERAAFKGLSYFAPDGANRVQARLEDGDGSELLIEPAATTGPCDTGARRR